MATFNIEFKLKLTDLETLETKIVPLPDQENIFEIFCGEYQIIYVVDKDGKARPAMAHITVVDNFDIELV